MARHSGGFFGTILVCGLLAGCGLHMFAEREPWRAQAEEECLAQKGVQVTAYAEPLPAINGSSSCGMDHPFRVAAFANGEVALTSKAVLACPAINTVDHWLEEVVQPATRLYFGTSVVEMKAGSYSCRPMNNQAGAGISEHAYGNAADIFSFRFADGREVSVERGWRGDPREQEFLREIFVGACTFFSTVLAPGSDVFHYNHIHVDLARRSHGRTVCKPIIKWTPRLVATGAQSQPETASRDTRLEQAATHEQNALYPSRPSDSSAQTGRNPSRHAVQPPARGSLQQREDLPDEATDEDRDPGPPLDLHPQQLGAARQQDRAGPPQEPYHAPTPRYSGGYGSPADLRPPGSVSRY